MFNICRFYYHITKVHEVAYNSAQGVQVCAQFEAQFRQQLSPCGEQECTNERKFSEECIRRKEAKEHIIEDFKEYERRNTLEGEIDFENTSKDVLGNSIDPASEMTLEIQSIQTIDDTDQEGKNSSSWLKKRKSIKGKTTLTYLQALNIMKERIQENEEICVYLKESKKTHNKGTYTKNLWAVEYYNEYHNEVYGKKYWN